MSTKRSSPHSGDTSSDTRLEDYRDPDLARLACQGTKEAWDALYLRHKDFLQWFARERLKLPQELTTTNRRGVEGSAITVEQFMNEVYIRMWDRNGRRFCSYKERASFPWWYEAVAANIYSDLCRQERRANPSGKRIPFEDEDDE